MRKQFQSWCNQITSPFLSATVLPMSSMPYCKRWTSCRRRIGLSWKLDLNWRSSGKPSVVFSALQREVKEIRLTVGDWHPIFAANQSFRDRKYMPRSGCIELIGRTAAERKGGHLFDPRCTRVALESIFSSSTVRSLAPRLILQST